MRWSRRSLIVFAGLVLVTVWLQTPPATPSVFAFPATQRAQLSIPAAAQRRGVFATTASLAPAPAPNAARSAVLGTVDPAPFSFVGTIMDHGEPVVLLFRDGRTLKVRDTGPVADDYQVDALLDNLVVLRHLPSGTQQFIELSARNPLPLSSLPEDFPRD